MQRDSFFDDVDLAGLPAAEQLLAELGANLPADAVADDGIGQSCPIHLIVKVEAGSASGRTAEPMFVKLQRITPHTAEQVCRYVRRQSASRSRRRPLGARLPQGASVASSSSTAPSSSM